MLTSATQTVSGGFVPPDYRFHAVTAEGRVYLKENPYLGIRTYMIFQPDGVIKIRKTQRVDKIIDRNLAAQSDFAGFKKPLTMIASVPIVVDQEFKKRAGFNNKTGEYDVGKYNSLLDDRDNYKLKTVPKKIGTRKAMI